MQTYNYPVVIEKDEDGYYATCPSLQGCHSQGDTYEEAIDNIEDAIRLHIQDRLEHKEKLSKPATVSISAVNVVLQ